MVPVVKINYDYEIVGTHFPMISHYLCRPAQPQLLNSATFKETEGAVSRGRSYADVHCQYPTWLHTLTIQSIEVQLRWILPVLRSPPLHSILISRTCSYFSLHFPVLLDPRPVSVTGSQTAEVSLENKVKNSVKKVFL